MTVENDPTATSGAAPEVLPAADAAPAPVPEVVVETPATAEPPAEKPFAHTDVPSMLAPETKAEDKPAEAAPDSPKVETKTEDKPADGEKPPAEAVPEAPVEAASVEYKFTAPEGVTLDEARIAPYTDVLREHNIPPEVGQKFLDMHTAALQQIQANMVTDQQRAFAQYREYCKTQLMADEELGGAAIQTTTAAVARVRDMFVSSAEPGSGRYQKDWAEFNEFLNVTGAGEQRALWRILNNVARALDEPPPTPAGGTPPPNHGKAPSRKGMGSLYNPELYKN